MPSRIDSLLEHMAANRAARSLGHGLPGDLLSRLWHLRRQTVCVRRDRPPASTRASWRSLSGHSAETSASGRGRFRIGPACR
jgi:hypothetical protein